LGIPGENAEGVVDAISFIYNLRTHDYSQTPVGDKVAVIGMGMTAIDAATQSKRLGAKEVTMIYRRTEAEKPCTQEELDIARLDGCSFVWLASPKEIISENGKVKQLLCSKMKLGEVDASGRKSPVATDETITLEVDMVIKAAGQIPFLDVVQKAGLENKDGKVVLSDTKSTNLKGVFAGGDCVNGGKEVVNAVQEGKDGAQNILTYLGIK
jgi:glutamate synthase (NADPH/NADH) small chain